MTFTQVPTERVSTQQNLPTYDAQDLTKDGIQANIMLGDQLYVLRITRAGKLILTK